MEVNRILDTAIRCNFRLEKIKKEKQFLDSMQEELTALFRWMIVLSAMRLIDLLGKLFATGLIRIRFLYTMRRLEKDYSDMYLQELDLLLGN